MTTVIHPGEHAMTITVNGRAISTNRVQLIAARHMLKLHVVGIRNKVSPVSFMNRLTGERRTAKSWLTFLNSVL
jgi:hypothetical protein